MKVSHRMLDAEACVNEFNVFNDYALSIFEAKQLFIVNQPLVAWE